jgi:protein-S-isoprenylcysteine O-methyltransferase Ste14
VNRTHAAAGSATFFVLTPGTVAGLVPWLITRYRLPELSSVAIWAYVVAGLVLVSVGLAVLVMAFARFVSEGRGTPAPVAPTEQLVVGGTYRYVRNPMYVAVLAVIVGQALAFRSLGLIAYAALVWALTAAFVRWYEEPVLQARYGPSYEAYRRSVRAWIPRRRPWAGPR